jgi:glycosyltransferase involved in cell wall biosynthesis
MSDVISSLPRKIFHIREANIFGSPERLIIGQITNSKRFSGIPVSYRKAGEENAFVAELKKHKIPYFELTEHFTGDISTVFRLSSMIRQFHPSMIITHEYKSNLYGYLASKITRIPHLIHFHGATSEDLKVKFYNAIDRWVLRRVQGVITVSSATKTRLIEAGVQENKIHVIFNAVANEAFEPVPFQNKWFDLPSPLFVCAGRFSYEKGVDILIEAVCLLRDSGTSINVLIYGDGPEKQNIQNLITRYNLSNLIKLAGFEKDLRGVFGAAYSLIIPSRSEGFPLVLLETWAQGTPVVTTPVGGLPEIVSDNKNGVISERVDPESLASALKRALTIPDFKIRCGQAGKKEALEKYTFAKQAEHLETIYDRYALKVQ